MCWQTEKWLGEINELVTGCKEGRDRRRHRAGGKKKSREAERFSCARVRPAGGRMK